jgi:hypothetical protein
MGHESKHKGEQNHNTRPCFKLLIAKLKVKIEIDLYLNILEKLSHGIYIVLFFKNFNQFS